jgi:hypothetical protein
MPATSGRQENTSQDIQADLRAESCNASSRDFHQALENKWLGIMEEPPPSQMKEETTNSSCAGAVGVSHWPVATFESFVAIPGVEIVQSI